MLWKLDSISGGEGCPCTSLFHHGIQHAYCKEWAHETQWTPQCVLNRKSQTYLWCWVLGCFLTQLPWQQGLPYLVGPKCKFLNSALSFKEGKIQALIDRLTQLSHLLLSDFHLHIPQTFLESPLCISDTLFLLSLVVGGGWHVSSYSVDLRTSKPVDNFVFIWAKLTTYSEKQNLKCPEE